MFTSPVKSALGSWEDERLSEESLGHDILLDVLTFVERGGGLAEKREEVDIAMIRLVRMFTACGG